MVIRSSEMLKQGTVPIVAASRVIWHGGAGTASCLPGLLKRTRCTQAGADPAVQECPLYIDYYSG